MLIWCLWVTQEAQIEPSRSSEPVEPRYMTSASTLGDLTRIDVLAADKVDIRADGGAHAFIDLISSDGTGTSDSVIELHADEITLETISGIGVNLLLKILNVPRHDPGVGYAWVDAADDYTVKMGIT